MSKVSNLIFHNEKHYVTSKFGNRASITTSNGNTSTFHNGTDYGTNGEKIAQYAIEDGEILTATKAADGALYVWVSYPRLGVKMLHYHLDSISVKAGQKVNKNTILGYTGMTGKATGVHLHLGIKKLSGGDYIDPEKWSETEYTAPPKKTTTTNKTNTTSTASKVVTAKDSAKSFKETLAGTYTVNASALNIRHGAGTNKAVMTIIPKNKTVKNYGYYTTISGVKWLYVQFTHYGVKYTGFASSKYLVKK